MFTILCIVGNNRPGNYTAMALEVVKQALEAEGAALRIFDGQEHSLPWPGQIDASPEALASKKYLQELTTQADGIVFASPEYHGSFSAYAKLIIENLEYPSLLAGKPMALLGVAAGRIGAIKCLEQLRTTCAHSQAIVLPTCISIAGVRAYFSADGVCNDLRTQAALMSLANALLNFLYQHVQPRKILDPAQEVDEESDWDPDRIFGL